jgi:chitin disaccharide deacetylase
MMDSPSYTDLCMAARLILNADDFGLTRGINRAVAELHQAGALTSATLMAAGPAFDDAVAVAHANPALGVGCHIVLTNGSPVSVPETIPTLLGKDDHHFRASLPEFLLAVVRGKVNEEDIYSEALAQIQKLQCAGITVSHVDTHKHTHILPGVARPLLRAAHHAGVPCIRNPFEKPWSLALGSSGILRSLQVRIIRHLQSRFLALPEIVAHNVHTSDGTIGVAVTGNLNGPTLRAVLDAMPEGTWELVCHPGYNDVDLDAVTTRLRRSREIERDALISIFAKNSDASVQPNPVELINYRSLE